MKFKILIVVMLLIVFKNASADQVQTGVTQTTGYVQTIGLSVCGLGGVVGAIMLAFNNESGSSWIAKALIAASAIGAVPFAVNEIGSFFGIA
jgi:hypothetical protein